MKTIDTTRHSALGGEPWAAPTARHAIAEIVADAEAAFDPDDYWPTHPQDDGIPARGTGLYFGASGVLWGLDYLQRQGAAGHRLDIDAILTPLLEANRREFEVMARALGVGDRRASWLFGDLPILLMMMRRGSPQAAEELRERIAGSVGTPVLEIMWGAPGAMLACVFADRIAADDRWRTLYLALADRLLADLGGDDPAAVWLQRLYGQERCYLGLVHGYAGNIAALLKGWDWLPDGMRARVAVMAATTLDSQAIRSADGVNWPAVSPGQGVGPLVQVCHGAPGMVLGFAGPGPANPELTALLQEGGRLTWAAGPLAKGSNLCHGTAGNGFAFLKLHALTGEAVWLQRARAFAMTAIQQYRVAKSEHGRGRFSLWTGDIGVACYLWACLEPSEAFPTLDVF